MGDDDKTDLRSQLGLRKFRDRLPGVAWRRWSGGLDRARDRAGLSILPTWLFLILAVTWALVAATLFFGFYAVLWQMIFQDPPAGQEAVWNWRFSIAQLVAVTTVLGAMIALPITINRLVLTRRQTETTEQGHITDRINTAVQGLGAEKEVNRIGRPVRLREIDPDFASMEEEDTEERRTEIEWRGEQLRTPVGMCVEDVEEWQVFAETKPNLEVRIGAIYALERIAQDSDRDHVQIMEILCAYIRQNAPAPAEDDWPELEMKESEEDGPLEADFNERLETFREAQEEAKSKLKLREDIQTALTVIGRRSAKQWRLEAGRGTEAPFPFDTACPEYDGPEEDHDRAALDAYREKLDAWQGKLGGYEGYRLDLRGADLRGAALADHDLKGAILSGTYFQGAFLVAARLQGAVIWEAKLQGAVLRGAVLQGAVLGVAQFQGADLRAAQWQGADLQDVNLQGAQLERIQLQGAVLGDAHLQGAHLGTAQLQGARLAEPRLQGAFLWKARLQGAQLGLARLQAAGLVGARLQGALLVHARLQGADLVEAQLNGALIVEPQFDSVTALNSANLQKTGFAGVNFTDFPQIAEHLDGMFGDATVTLPGGHGPEHENWPPHWPKFELRDDFVGEWHKWQDDPETYTPPDPPKPDEPA